MVLQCTYRVVTEISSWQGATLIVAGGNPRPPALNDSPDIVTHIQHYFSHQTEKKRQVHLQIQLITMFSRCIDSAETTVFDPPAEKEPTHCGFVLV